MRTKKLILFGAGGHGKVVLDILMASPGGAYDVIVADANPKLQGENFQGHTIVTPLMYADLDPSFFHVSIGHNIIRRTVFQELLGRGHHAMSVVHPAAVISRFASIDSGTLIAAQSVIAPGVSVGAGVIVNHGAIVDHDCSVGDFSHIAPNATLGGDVRVGSNVLIGAGAVVLPGVSIGEGAIIGAGAVIISDVDAFSTMVGVPGRMLQKDKLS